MNNSNFNGVIIEESLENSSVLEHVKIIETNVVPVNKDHKTPWLKKWTLHTVEIEANKAEEVSKLISDSLDSEHEWYADYRNNNYHYVIFRNNIFKVNRSENSQYDAVMDYGIAKGIPRHQLDFSYHISEWEKIIENNLK